ncbi:hypothetical protein AAH029_00865 [Parabacteroides distasonis]|uniref:hypothetical protein n=1 Tax=Parabacteroides distasonis TaxID=823 RepID=UPI0039B442CB
MLYNSINHGVICTDQVVEYTNHVVVCTSHVDLLEIDQVASMFVYGKKNVYYLGIRRIVLGAVMAVPIKQAMRDLNGMGEKPSK